MTKLLHFLLEGCSILMLKRNNKLNKNSSKNKLILNLQRYLVLSCLLFVNQGISSDELNEPVGLFLKPKSCVVEEKDKSCEASIQVEWRLKSKRSVCLTNDSQPRALACWQNKSFNVENFTIDINSNTRFYLRDQITNEIIYSTPFNLYLKLVKYRKKRRNPWSFY